MRNCFEEIDSIMFTCRKNRILTCRKDTRESYIFLCFIKSKNDAIYFFSSSCSLSKVQGNQ